MRVYDAFTDGLLYGTDYWIMVTQMDLKIAWDTLYNRPNGFSP